MAKQERYDGGLQMFVTEARQPDEAHVRFLRWLAERGALEHGVSGPPSGDLVTKGGTDSEPVPTLKVQFRTNVIAGLDRARRLGI